MTSSKLSGLGSHLSPDRKHSGYRGTVPGLHAVVPVVQLQDVQFWNALLGLDGFAFRSWGTTGTPGFFQNSGEFGIEMCIFLPLIVAFILALGKHWPRWQRWVAWGWPAPHVTGIVASSSRGAFIGLGAVVLWHPVEESKKDARLAGDSGRSAAWSTRSHLRSRKRASRNRARTRHRSPVRRRGSRAWR